MTLLFFFFFTATTIPTTPHVHGGSERNPHFLSLNNSLISLDLSPKFTTLAENELANALGVTDRAFVRPLELRAFVSAFTFWYSDALAKSVWRYDETTRRYRRKGMFWYKLPQLAAKASKNHEIETLASGSIKRAVCERFGGGSR
ncbi:uncharacterized protein LOC109707839 [Ananas comosus]|uniref:Uncharacterized protein LOC109707839 n=1 Tax=Ananas comosus TaxID=4615 RepID=A0A6P5EUY4_ANACO|nr:uncharacterized protein LOC109707839 [Ananas comosus]